MSTEETTAYYFSRPTLYACCSAVAGGAEMRAGRRTRLYQPGLAVRLSNQHHAVDAA